MPEATATRPWERRLGDLAQALQNCHDTYFSPELFRRNTNHFLQTSRTVTFLIQKSKSSIPGFDAWYSDNVHKAWADDQVMSWAKESRNYIEKEGDLETHSQLNLSLLYSYLTEQDVHVATGRSELLSASLKKLVRFARARLPTGVEDAAVVRVERRWVANTLPDWELLQALRRVYARVHTVCRNLSRHLGEAAQAGHPDPNDFEHLAHQAQQICFFKLSDLAMHQMVTVSHRVSRSDEPPASIKAVVERLKPNAPGPLTFEGTFRYMVQMAEATFNHFGSHVPMLFLFDNQWQPIDFVSAHFSDQTDKFLFWRSTADRIKTLDAHGLSWTSESWIRSMADRFSLPIRKMPITGERLHTLVMDKSGGMQQALWTISRDTTTNAPTLARMTDLSELSETVPYYLVPAMRAFGLPDPEPRSPASAA